MIVGSNPIRFLMVCICLAGAISNSASARVWQVDFDQAHPVFSALKTLAPEDLGKPCPDNFRPVHLTTETDLDQIGSFAANSNSPDIYHSTLAAEEDVNKNMRFSLSVDVKGCVFQNHFLPREGHVTISGDLGIAQLAHFRYEIVKPEHGEFGGGGYVAGYTAFIGGPPLFSREIKWGKYVSYELPENINDDQVMGALWLELPEHGLKLISEKRSDETMRFNWSQVRILILPEDTLN